MRRLRVVPPRASLRGSLLTSGDDGALLRVVAPRRPRTTTRWRPSPHAAPPLRQAGARALPVLLLLATLPGCFTRMAWDRLRAPQRREVLGEVVGCRVVEGAATVRFALDGREELELRSAQLQVEAPRVLELTRVPASPLGAGATPCAALAQWNQAAAAPAQAFSLETSGALGAPAPLPPPLQATAALVFHVGDGRQRLVALSLPPPEGRPPSREGELDRRGDTRLGEGLVTVEGPPHPSTGGTVAFAFLAPLTALADAVTSPVQLVVWLVARAQLPPR